MKQYNKESELPEFQIAVKKAINIECAQIDEPFEVVMDNGVMDSGNPGDYLMRGVKGELYICPQDVFDASYNIVSVDNEKQAEELKERLLEQAKILEETFRGNTFTIEQMDKKFKSSKSYHASLLSAMVDLGYCAIIRGYKGETRFKITITAKDKLNVLSKDIEAAKSVLNSLVEEQLRLEKELVVMATE